MNLHVNLIFFQLNKTVNQIATYQKAYMRYVLYDIGIWAVCIIFRLPEKANPIYSKLLTYILSDSYGSMLPNSCILHWKGKYIILQRYNPDYFIILIISINPKGCGEGAKVPAGQEIVFISLRVMLWSQFFLTKDCFIKTDTTSY
jgi:hypothetical protein